MELEDLDDINIGDVLMWIGTAMLAVGGFGLVAYTVFIAFTVAIPLGLLTVFGFGLLIGILGHSLDN